MSEQTDAPTVDGGADDRPIADIVTAVVLLAVSAVGWWTLLVNPELVGSDYGVDPGPALMPQISLGLLSGLALALGGRAGLRHARLLRRGGPSGPVPMPWTAARLTVPALLVATMTGYALVFPSVGFVWATFGFALFWTVVLGAIAFPPTTGRRISLYAAEAALITALVWIAFGWIIGVPLP